LDGSLTQEVERLDLPAEAWSLETPMPFATGYAATALHEGRIWLFPFASASAPVQVFDAPECAAVVPPPPRPPEVTGVLASRSGPSLALAWSAAPGAATYLVSRGSIVPSLWRDDAYDHAADDAAGRGACDAGADLGFADPDDATDGEASYYLVTAVSACGIEGLTGTDSLGRDSPARQPAASCP
jgi:hypothetical protein